MDEHKLTPGENVPTDVNAVIEIPKGGGHIKYEFNHKMGAMVVDRLRDSAMVYPANYGYIPQTLSEDGDPLDVLVIYDNPIQTGVVVGVRPIGALIMEDESGMDVKIIAVPADRLTDAYKHIQDLKDLSVAEKKKIEQFFVHYKDLEDGKWSKISGWEDVNGAHAHIHKSIKKAASAAAASKKKTSRPCLPLKGRQQRKHN